MANDVVESGSQFIYKKVDAKSKLLKVIVLILFLTFVGFFIPLTLLTVGGGMSVGEYMQKYTFYGVGMGVCGLVLLILSVAEILTKGKVDVIIHDPEQGVLKDVKFIYNPWILMLISLIFGVILGLFSVYKNTFFVGVTQSILPNIVIENLQFLKIYFAAEPAASVETAVFLCFLAITSTAANYILAAKGKQGVSRKVYSWLILPIALATGLLWMGYHLAAYPGNDAALLNVFIFGFLGSLITILIQSFIVWWAIHFTANAFLVINTMFSNDIATVWAIVLVAILSLLLVLSFMITKKLKGKKNES